MHADYSVELGRGDPALELPWSSDDPATRYYDLKQNPDLVYRVPESVAHPELNLFLARINAPGFPLQTAKCDAWYSRELSDDEKIYGGAGKFVAYMDLVFAAEKAVPADSTSETTTRRLAFAEHEMLARNLCALLKRAPEMAAAAELVIRRCYYHHDPEMSASGFCFTLYVSGFGSDEAEARRRWSIALALVQNALVQVAMRPDR